MSNDLHILLVDDDEDDFVLTRDLLCEAFDKNLSLDWVQTWDEASQTIENLAHDLYLVDYQLGARTGLELIRETMARGFTKPFILLTGQDSREVDLEAMNAGASDYLVKGQITAPLLNRAIRYAIERKKVEQRLLSLSQYDPLTGLANRSLFQSRLNEAIADSKRTGEMFSLLLLDLDHFKDVNDTLGHSTGDELLKCVAERLTDCTRETDTVARLGGDEFIVLATHINSSDAAEVLAQHIIGAFAKPFEIEGREIYSATSVGITLCPTDGSEPEPLLKGADLALYRAKSEGRGTYQMFDVEIAVRTQERKSLETELGRALAEQELVLYYQPQIDTSNGRLVGAEALLRWPHPSRGAIPPDEFIPVAERCGLIVPLGDWVIGAASAQISTWNAAELAVIPVAVNLSAAQLRMANLVETVAQSIERNNVDARLLQLELTESMMMDKIDAVTELLHELHYLGVTLAIDDFGTGYSSLSRLKRLPVDKLKIDRSFVRDIINDPDDAAIVTAITTLGRSLNIEVIAEGVETQAQLDFLREQGCQQVQGYVFSAPLPEKEFERWLSKGTAPAHKSAARN